MTRLEDSRPWGQGEKRVLVLFSSKHTTQLAFSVRSIYLLIVPMVCVFENLLWYFNTWKISKGLLTIVTVLAKHSALTTSAATEVGTSMASLYGHLLGSLQTPIRAQQASGTRCRSNWISQLCKCTS